MYKVAICDDEIGTCNNLEIYIVSAEQTENT